MLVAELNGARVAARIAIRESQHVCPNCKGDVTLRRGRKVVANFAHKAYAACPWRTGETTAHLTAKDTIAQALTGGEDTVEVECFLPLLSGDRRADVLVTTTKGVRIAIELQHTPLLLPEAERRAFSYAKAGIAQIWIPFVRPNMLKEGSLDAERRWIVPKYNTLLFERWVDGFHRGQGMWMYDARRNRLWHAKLKKQKRDVPDKSFYTESGDEEYFPGGPTNYKAIKHLTLTGPYRCEDLVLRWKTRDAFSGGKFNWPACRIATFEAKRG